MKNSAVHSGIPAPSSPDLTGQKIAKIRQELALALTAHQEFGQLNPRPDGLANHVAQLVKKVIRRSLSWYTRPNHHFQNAVIQALQQLADLSQQQEAELQQQARNAEFIRTTSRRMNDRLSREMQQIRADFCRRNKTADDTQNSSIGERFGVTPSNGRNIPAMLGEGLMQYWWTVYRHCKTLNQRTDIYRNVEDAFAIKHGDRCLDSEKIYLDIGSGSSPVPTLLHQNHMAKTYATELDPVYLEKQRAYVKALGMEEDNGFIVQREDATQLSFASGSVDFITVVSTIEHIPGNGDILAMAEFARVMPTGGRLVVTVPTAETYVENQSTWYYGGFERRYDPEALQSRLSHADLKLVDQVYMVSPAYEFTRRFQRDFEEIFLSSDPVTTWYKNGWHDQYPDLSILMTMAFIDLSPNPTGSFGACLAFEKI